MTDFYEQTVRKITALEKTVAELSARTAPFNLTLRKAYARVLSGGIVDCRGQGYIALDPDVSPQDLDTINGGADGQVLFLRCLDAADTITLKDGVGNLSLKGGDITMTGNEEPVMILFDAYVGVSGLWLGFN